MHRFLTAPPLVSTILPGMAMIPGMAAAPMVQPSIGPVALKLESSPSDWKLLAGTQKIGGL